MCRVFNRSLKSFKVLSIAGKVLFKPFKILRFRRGSFKNFKMAIEGENSKKGEKTKELLMVESPLKGPLFSKFNFVRHLV